PTANVPAPPDQSQEMLARAQAADQPLGGGGFNANAYRQSLAQNPTLQNAAGAPAAVRGNPAASAARVVPTTADLKGANTLNAGAPSGQAGIPGAPNPNSPGTLYIPRAQGTSMDLSPEKKLLKTTNTLGGQQVGE